MTALHAQARDGLPGATVERFEFARVGEHLVVARLVAQLAATLPPAHDVRLLVESDLWSAFETPARACALERRLTATLGAEPELLWRAAFALPFELVQAPSSRFSLDLGAVQALILPAPVQRFALPRALELSVRRAAAQRPAFAGARRRAAAFATAMAVTAGSTPAAAYAAAGAGSGGGASGSGGSTGASSSVAAPTATAQPAVTTASATTTAPASTTTTPGSTTTTPGSTTTTPGSKTTTPGSTTTTPGSATTAPGSATATAPATTTTTTTPTAPAGPPTSTAPAGESLPVSVDVKTSPAKHPRTRTSSKVSRLFTAPAKPARQRHRATATSPTTTGTAPTGTAPTGTAPAGAAPASTAPGSTSVPSKPSRAQTGHGSGTITSPTSLTGHGPSHHRTARPSSKPASGGAPVSGGATPTVGGLSQSAPGFLGPASWTGTVAPNQALTGAVENLSGLLSSADRPPSFLIPIYMQAGARFNVPWEVLAAINSIESAYGSNLNTSSAGAIGWMQFEPSTWKQYGMAVDGHSVPNPYDPRDAIFSAARYLAAAGAAHDISTAIYAYNHAGWYVSEVLARARAIASTAQFEGTLVRHGTFSVDFATGLPRHPTVSYSGGVLSHYDRLIAAANMVSAANFPYLYGGGHEQPALFGPFDCSGAVSYVMQQAGYNVPTTVSGDIPIWRFPAGPGRVTIFYNAGHTFMRIGDRYFGTSGFARGGGGGAGWFDVNQLSVSYLDTFNEVHVPNLGVDSFAPSSLAAQIAANSASTRHDRKVRLSLTGLSKLGSFPSHAASHHTPA